MSTKRVCKDDELLFANLFARLKIFRKNAEEEKDEENERKTAYYIAKRLASNMTAQCIRIPRIPNREPDSPSLGRNALNQKYPSLLQSQGLL